MRVPTSALVAVVLLVGAADAATAQIVTIGGGALLSKRAPEPVLELHAATPPVADWRGYVTLAWSDGSAAPTAITAAERPVLRFGDGFTGLGGGLLWLEARDYQPDPMLVSSTVVPLPIPRTSLVVIASTLPLRDFAWSLVLKAGITVLSAR